MLTRTNIEQQLLNQRSKRVGEEDIMNEVFSIFKKNEDERKKIVLKLTSGSEQKTNQFNLDLLESSNIFHLEDIKALCTNYRLRFLDSKFFKGEIPEEAISKIRSLEALHQTSLGNFKIVAPAKLLKLENADDPLLLAPLGNDYFYLIHKWGNDLHPFRKLLMWPFKSFDNLTITVVFMSILLTVLAPMHWFTTSPGIGNYIFLFMIILNGVGGMVLLYGVAKGKNFNTDIWNSKYYNG
ncbi:MAG TPA: hypothetical protein VKX40_03940 [Aequorivita sp.]|nr:hypothetical protein [Aequorivita sp.]